jgi:hypothetical protein
MFEGNLVTFTGVLLWEHQQNPNSQAVPCDLLCLEQANAVTRKLPLSALKELTPARPDTQRAPKTWRKG